MTTSFDGTSDGLSDFADSRVPRDLRLDLMRGAALLVMFVDHFRSNALSAWTPGKLGYSDMATMFVFVSGCAGGAVHTKCIRSHGLQKCYGKAFLRIIQLALAVIVTVFVMWCVAGLLRVQVFHSLCIFKLPSCALQVLGILLLNCLFVGMLPLMVWLKERHWSCLLIPSLSVYMMALLSDFCGVAISFWFRISGFHPLCWQLLFATGVLSFPWMLCRDRPKNVQRDCLSIPAAVIFNIGCLDAMCFGRTHGIWTDKSNLGPLVYLHGISVVYLLMTCLPHPGNGFWRWWFIRKIVACGQSSLLLFCVGSVVQVLVEQTVFPQQTSLGVQFLHVGLLWSFCFLVCRRNTR